MDIHELTAYCQSHKDDNIKIVGDVLQHVFSSHYLDTYITLKGQMDFWNSEIREKQPSIFVEAKEIEGTDKIAYFDNYKNTESYICEMDKLTKSLDALKAKLLPDEFLQIKDNKPKATEDILLSVTKTREKSSTF